MIEDLLEYVSNGLDNIHEKSTRCYHDVWCEEISIEWDAVAKQAQEIANQCVFKKDDPDDMHYFVDIDEHLANDLGFDMMVICIYKGYERIDGEISWKSSAYEYEDEDRNNFCVYIYNCLEERELDENYAYDCVIQELANFQRDAEWVRDDIYEKQINHFRNYYNICKKKFGTYTTNEGRKDKERIQLVDYYLDGQLDEFNKMIDDYPEFKHINMFVKIAEAAYGHFIKTKMCTFNIPEDDFFSLIDCTFKGYAMMLCISAENENTDMYPLLSYDHSCMLYIQIPHDFDRNPELYKQEFIHDAILAIAKNYVIVTKEDEEGLTGKTLPNPNYKGKS